MKAKHILTFVSLAGFMAACSNEELLDKNNVPQLKDREVIDLKLAAEFGEANEMGAITRQVPGISGGFEWVSTDKIGACLVDPTTQYIVVNDKHFGNNRYENSLAEGTSAASTSFSTSATMVAGSYVFYYPFSDVMSQERTGIKATLPQIQEYDTDATKMLGNNFMVTPVINVNAQSQGTVAPVFRSIYGYGDIQLTFDEAVKVQKIVLSSTEGGAKFILNSVVTPSNFNIAELRPGEEIEGSKYATVTEADNAFKASQLENDKITQADVAVKTLNSLSDADKIVLNCLGEDGKGIAVASGTKFQSRMLIPAGTYSKIIMDVYTDKGVYQKKYEAVKVARGFTINLADANRTAATKVVAFEAKDKETMESSVVINQNDLIAVINGATTSATIKVAPIGSTVEINDDVIEALGSEKKLEVTSPISVKGNATGTTLKNITFNDNVDIIAGKIIIGEGTVATGGKLWTIAAGAKLIANNAMTNKPNITNTGILSMTASAFEDITNNGIMTISAKNKETAPIAAGQVTNNGTININATTTITALNNGTGADRKTPAIEGTVTINADATITTLTNTAGTVTNKASLTMAGENNGQLTNSGTLKTSATFTNNSTIDNTGTIEGADHFVNLGTLNNNSTAGGTVSIQVNGSSESMTAEGAADAKIYPVEGSMTTVTNNYGSIYYTDGALISSPNNHGIADHKRYGHVVFTYNGSNTDGLNSAFEATVCSKLVLNQDFTIESGKSITVEAIKIIEIEGGTMTVNGEQTLFHCPIFIAKNSTFKGSKTLTMNDTRLVIDDNTILTINGGKIAGAGSEGLIITNNGEVRNFGSVTSINNNSSTKGKWTGTPWAAKE